MIKRDDGAYISYDMLAAEVAACREFFTTATQKLQAIGRQLDVLESEVRGAMAETKAMREQLAALDE